MIDQEYERFVERLLITAEVYGEELSSLKAGAYFAALRDLSLSVVGAALGRVERHSKWWPKPADIREAVYRSPESEYLRRLLHISGVDVPSLATVEEVE